MAIILIIDDDRAVSKYLSMVLEEAGHTPTCAHLLQEGLIKCEQEEFDIVFLDIKLPDGDGLEALPRIQKFVGSPEVIIITGEGDPDGAELAIKSGAWDYIEKPISIDSVLLPVNRALLYHIEKKSKATLDSFKRQIIVGNSPQLNESIFIASRSANRDANTLIYGETGTGKELFARAIHDNSSRWQNNFVVVDCTALPDKLVESILFGYRKGAFTGADEDKEGLVKSAHNGTLFLDEVGELPHAIQKKLLRVLQEKKFRPVGSEDEEESNFSLISATNRNLHTLVEQGKFRQDLLFRLQNIYLELPPLRERDGDIKILASHFINKFCMLDGVPIKTLSEELLAAMHAYNWPGNVRELINVTENVFSASGTGLILYPDHLPVAIRAQIAKLSIKQKEQQGKAPVEIIPKITGATLDPYKLYRENVFHEMEKHYMIELMKTTEGKINQACTISGLSRSRIYELLKKYNISRNKT